MHGGIRTARSCHLDIFNGDRAAGWYEIPILRRCHAEPERLTGFNDILSRNRADLSAGVHFYLDDYQFERLWARTERYMPILSRFSCVLTPDFSLYMDMPRAMKIWNVYRSRLLGQMMQDAGMDVIPTLSWAEPETFSFCFDGIEPGGTVSVSTVGVKRSREASDAWLAGFREAVRRLQPSCVILYGDALDGMEYGGRLIRIRNEVTARMKERASHGRPRRIERNQR